MCTISTLFGNIFLVTLMSLVVVATSLPQAIDEVEDRCREEYYLGTVEGKSYFSKINCRTTWLEAQANCSRSGMNLASISTQAQYDFLKSKVNTYTFIAHFWTSGIEVSNTRKFKWNVDPNAPLYETSSTPPQDPSCLKLHVMCCNAPSIFSLDGWDCTDRFGTLCEVVH